MWRLSWMIQMDIIWSQGSLWKGVGGIRVRGESNVRMAAETGVSWSQAKECQQLPKARQGKESLPLESPEQTNLASDTRWGSQTQVFLSPVSCRQDSSLHYFPWVPKGRFQQLLIKRRAAKKPPEVKLKGVWEGSVHTATVKMDSHQGPTI